MPKKRAKQSRRRKASKRPTGYISTKSNPLAQAVVTRVTDWAKEKPNEVVMGMASSDKLLTRNAIRHHIVRKTALGQRLLKGWMDAAVRSVVTAKAK